MNNKDNKFNTNDVLNAICEENRVSFDSMISLLDAEKGKKTKNRLHYISQEIAREIDKCIDDENK